SRTARRRTVCSSQPGPSSQDLTTSENEFAHTLVWRAILVGRDLGTAGQMCRPLRFQAAGLVYHIMARGNNKMAIFLDERDYARFLEILSEVVPDFAIDCWVFCVMPNHYHLVLRTRCANLSLAIRHLN